MRAVAGIAIVRNVGTKRDERLATRQVARRHIRIDIEIRFLSVASPVLLWSQEVLSKVIIDSDGYCIWERVGTKSFTGFLFLLLTLTLAFSFDTQLVESEFTSDSGSHVARVIPEVVELGPRNVTGQTFSIAVVVENMTRLSGLDIAFQYDPIYLDYVNHTMTMPVEDFPDPIPPSPYPGIIHDPRLCLDDDVYTEQGSYYVAFTTVGGPSFNGSGTVFVMTFRVKSQPTPGEDDIITGLDILRADYPCPIECSLPTIDGTVIIHAHAFHQLTVMAYCPQFLTIPFTVDGEFRTTPYTRILDEDFYTVEMPGNYSRYLWSHWLEDGDTNRTKTILLDADTTLTAVYTVLIGGETVSIESEHLSSWFASTLLAVALFSASSIRFKRKLIKGRM